MGQIRYYFIALLIPILWGATFPLTRLAITQGAGLTENFIFWRFLFASGLMLPFVMFGLIKKFSWLDLKNGAVIGTLNFALFYLQTAALEVLDSSTVAFLCTLNVVLVPILAPLFNKKQRRIKLIEILAAIVCTIGVYIICDADLHVSQLRSIFLVILGAFFSALSIIWVGKSSHESNNSLNLTFYQLLFNFLCPAAFFAPTIHFTNHTVIFWWAISYCVIFGTICAFYLQVKFQHTIGASKMAIIFSLESVTASIFAALLGETLPKELWLGGGLLLLSSVLPEVVHIVRGYLVKLTRDIAKIE